MSKWGKLLERMVADRNPVNYHYDDATQILRALGFTLAPHGGTSHRHWRLKREGKDPVYVGLIEKAGPMKPYLIRRMIEALSANDLLPDRE